MKKYKALVLDVDGTLVGSNYEISPRVKEAIFSIKDKILVSLCSGRCFDRIYKYVNELELTSLQISDGGGEIYDPVRQRAVYQKIIPQDTAEKIISDIKKNKYDYIVTQDSRYYLDKPYMDEEILLRYHFSVDKPMPEISSIKEPRFTKITIVGVNKENEKNITEMLRKYSEEVHFIQAAYGLVKTTAQYSIDITQKSATKLTALEEYAKLNKINLSETVVVGDGYNDFPLLMAGGLKIAMGNAADDLKKIADFVAPGVEDDGVAVVIEKFLKEK